MKLPFSFEESDRVTMNPTNCFVENVKVVFSPGVYFNGFKVVLLSLIGGLSQISAGIFVGKVMQPVIFGVVGVVGAGLGSLPDGGGLLSDGAGAGS
jgi:hypothetical protein